MRGLKLEWDGQERGFLERGRKRGPSRVVSERGGRDVWAMEARINTSFFYMIFFL